MKKIITESVELEVGTNYFLSKLHVQNGPGSSSGRVLGDELDVPGSIPGVGLMEIFLYSFVSSLIWDLFSLL